MHGSFGFHSGMVENYGGSELIEAYFNTRQLEAERKYQDDWDRAEIHATRNYTPCQTEKLNFQLKLNQERAENIGHYLQVNTGTHATPVHVRFDGPHESTISLARRFTNLRDQQLIANTGIVAICKETESCKWEILSLGVSERITEDSLGLLNEIERLENSSQREYFLRNVFLNRTSTYVNFHVPTSFLQRTLKNLNPFDATTTEKLAIAVHILNEKLLRILESSAGELDALERALQSDKVINQRCADVVRFTNGRSEVRSFDARTLEDPKSSSGSNSPISCIHGPCMKNYSPREFQRKIRKQTKPTIDVIPSNITLLFRRKNEQAKINIKIR